ncbi:MAG: hypothetical protein CMLOHMNK_02709 [Steroidobacteraceae bacterium]|nr:hypothetical protein [Steroidobacteraceae bacterium]
MTFRGYIHRAIRRLDESTQRLRALRSPPAPAPGPQPVATREKPRPAAPGEGSSGRVRHDERGNAVWDLAVSTGIFALENTSKLLKKLEAPELAIEDDRELRLEENKGRGYDPYNRNR